MFHKSVFVVFVALISLLILVSDVRGQADATVQAKTSNFKIVVDGLEVPAGATLVFNGKNYLSLDDISKAFDKPIKVDPVQKTIFIGKVPSSPTVYLSDLSPLNHQCTWGKNPEINKGAKGPLSIATNVFRKGIQLFAYVMRSAKKDEEVWIDFGLNQDYKRLTGKFGIDDMLLKESRRNDVFADFFVIGDDTILFSKENVKVGEIYDLDVDLSNVTRVRLMARSGITSTEAPVYLNFVEIKAIAE